MSLIIIACAAAVCLAEPTPNTPRTPPGPVQKTPAVPALPADPRKETADQRGPGTKSRGLAAGERTVPSAPTGSQISPPTPAAPSVSPPQGNAPPPSSPSATVSDSRNSSFTHGESAPRPPHPAYRISGAFVASGEGEWRSPAVDAAEHRLYIPREDGVAVVNSFTGSPVGFVDTPMGTHHIGLAPSLRRGYISNWDSNDVTVFDLRTLQVTTTVAAGDHPACVVFEPMTENVFVLNCGSGDATGFPASDSATHFRIPLLGTPSSAAADGRGNVFVSLSDRDEVLRIDGGTRRILYRAALDRGSRPAHLAIDTERGRLFSLGRNGMMAVLDADSGHLMENVSVGTEAHGLVFDPVGRFVIVANGDSTALVFGYARDGTLSRIQTLAAPRSGRTIAIDEETRHVFFPAAELRSPGVFGGRSPGVVAGSFRIVVAVPVIAPAPTPAPGSVR